MDTRVLKGPPKTSGLPLYSRQITCPWSILPHFQAMRRGHFSIPYNGHRVQPIENDLRKRTAKVPPTNKLYIMWRFVQHLGGGGGRWPFVPCSQCKGVLNSARLIQIRSRSSVTFQSRFGGSFRCIFDWSQPAFASRFMLLTQTSELSYEATVQSASQGPIYAVLFLCKIANYTLSRRRQLADVYVLCACTKKSFRTRIHIAPLLFFVHIKLITRLQS